MQLVEFINKLSNTLNITPSHNMSCPGLPAF